MCKRMLSCGIAILALTACADVCADDESGFYVGLSIGDATTRNSEVDFDGSDTAFKVLAGYAFNRYLAAEAAYVEAGTAEDDVGNLKVQFESSGVIASLVGSVPIGEHFSFFAKAGYAFYQTDQVVRLGNQREADSENGDDFAYS